MLSSQILTSNRLFMSSLIRGCSCKMSTNGKDETKGWNLLWKSLANKVSKIYLNKFTLFN